MAMDKDDDGRISAQDLHVALAQVSALQGSPVYIAVAAKESGCVRDRWLALLSSCLPKHTAGYCCCMLRCCSVHGASRYTVQTLMAQIAHSTSFLHA